MHEKEKGNSSFDHTSNRCKAHEQYAKDKRRFILGNTSQHHSFPQPQNMHTFHSQLINYFCVFLITTFPILISAIKPDLDSIHLCMSFISIPQNEFKERTENQRLVPIFIHCVVVFQDYSESKTFRFLKRQST